jgi:hypothetical protein
MLFGLVRLSSGDCLRPWGQPSWSDFSRDAPASLFSFNFGFGFAPPPACRLGGVLLIFGQRATPPKPSPARRGGSTSAAQEAGRALMLARAPALTGLSFVSALFCSVLLLTQLLQTAPLYPGPLCGGEVGSTGPAGGIDLDVDSFSSGQESCRKARPHLTDLPGRDARQAPRGVAFSFGYFSLGHSREK